MKYNYLALFLRGTKVAVYFPNKVMEVPVITLNERDETFSKFRQRMSELLGIKFEAPIDKAWHFEESKVVDTYCVCKVTSGELDSDIFRWVPLEDFLDSYTMKGKDPVLLGHLLQLA